METGPVEPQVRRLSDIDVRAVAEALDSGGPDNPVWWYDPATGDVEMGLQRDGGYFEEYDEGESPDDRGLVMIDPVGSHHAYADMEWFADAVGDRRAADRLQRALGGRGAFRRFRETIHELPDLVPHWRTFADAGSELRAIEWLTERGYLDADDAVTEQAARITEREAVLHAVGVGATLDVDVSVLPQRWEEIERHIDAGHDVCLLRDGQPWAAIGPH